MKEIIKGRIKKIRMKKRAGNLSISLPVVLIMLMAILITYQVRMNGIKIIKTLAEDSITGANLACLVIDKDTYGASHHMIIKNEDEAYDIYCKVLRSNMKLDDSNFPSSDLVIKGPVTIHRFIIYNVIDERITATEISLEGGKTVQVIDGQRGSMQTPDGTVITSTTVYSKIGFMLRGFMNSESYVYKEHSADITNE